jgi:hypothetical protein
MESSYKEYWILAEKSELNSHITRGTGEFIEQPQGRKPLKSKWCYAYKIDHTKARPVLVRFKARFVACGYSQIEGLDFEQTFSPVCKVQSLRLMISVTVELGLYIGQIDIVTAYLYGLLHEKNIMTGPAGYETLDKHGRPLCWNLIHSMYGLKQSGREWYRTVSEHLIKMKFINNRTDPSMFVRFNGTHKIYLLIYVDDFIIIATSEKLITDFKAEIKETFEIKDFGYQKVQQVLGLELVKFENSIYLGQSHYAKKVLQDADQWERPDNKGNFIPCGSRRTPMLEGWEHDIDSPILDPESKTEFHSILMKLSYLAQQSRPDLVCAVNILAQHQQDSRQHDHVALFRMLQYLRGTWDLGLHYVKTGTPGILFTNDKDYLNSIDWCPTAYADASYAQEPGRKSRSGFVFISSGAAISWLSKKQSVVAQSSSEAEYYSLSEAVKELLWERFLLTEIDLPLKKPHTVHEDNQSTIAIATNPISHKRVKHMDVKYFFLRDHLEKLDFGLVYCPTEEMIADIQTKALPPNTHEKFVNMMGMRSRADLEGNSVLLLHYQELRF